VVIDEAPRPGGQAYRRPPDTLDLDMARLLGSEHDAYQRMGGIADRVREKADYRPQTLAWGIHDKELYCHGPNGTDAVTFDALILATGATDRMLPVDGWTTPGVYTLGAAQVLLKDQGHAIGENVVFCGSSPLLYLAALQYRRTGGRVAAVLDTTSLGAKVRAVPQLAASLTTLRRGLSYMKALRDDGVRLELGVQIDRIRHDGDDHEVSGIEFRDRRGERRTIDCDAVALGYGLRPNAQLADLAGCAFRYDPHFRQWFPNADEDGRGGDGIYLAGDGAAIGGAEAAEVSGQVAALALLDDLGHSTPADPRPGLRRRLARLRRFQEGLAHAFAWPGARIRTLADDTIVCRCETVTAGDLRSAVAAGLGPREINRVKALTRCGMGRCQGRFCELAAAELIAAQANLPLEAIGRLRGQAPVKPLPVASSRKTSAAQ